MGYNKNDKFGFITLTGNKKEQITNGRKKYLVEGKCVCGVVKWFYNYSLKINQNKKSCGCKRTINKNPLKKREKHGMSKTRLYKIWDGICQRTGNPNRKESVNYGDRGITMCNEWRNSFIAFYNWSIENGYKDDLSIDRINNDCGYYPDNCRWADKITQANNTRRSQIYNKEYATVASKKLGGVSTLISRRIRMGWEIEKAFTTIARKRTKI